jgi:preprotein translocase subunit YajC
MHLLSATTQSTNPLGFLLPIALIGGVFYFMLVRPQQRKARAQQALVNAVEVGDDIITTAGIYGTVTDIDEEDGTVTVEIAPGTEIRMMRAGIGRRVVADDADDEDMDEDHEDDHGADQQNGPFQES